MFTHDGDDGGDDGDDDDFHAPFCDSLKKFRSLLLKFHLVQYYQK